MRPLSVLLVVVALSATACGGGAPEPSNVEGSVEAQTAVSVRFAEPLATDTVETTFPVRMTVEGVTLAPAGTMEVGTGHLHILINTDFIEPGTVIPSDDQHRHFGDASSQTELTLEPGEHTLRLQLADGMHVALDGDRYRDEIRIVVR